MKKVILLLLLVSFAFTISANEMIDEPTTTKRIVYCEGDDWYILQDVLGRWLVVDNAFPPYCWDDHYVYLACEIEAEEYCESRGGQWGIE